MSTMGSQANGHPVGSPGPYILGVGSASHDSSYSQEDVLKLFNVEDRRIRSVFLKGTINNRYLKLPDLGPDGFPHIETQTELLDKHRRVGIEIGSRALERCLERAEASIDDVRYLCCVSTTGLLTPGFSALLIDELKLRADCGRLDVVGMGCNAGMNALNAVNSWARVNPGQMAVLLCIEVCSAAYVFDGAMRSAVVNSLFGDGAAALAVMADPPGRLAGPQILKFASYLIPDTLPAMRYDWDETHGKFSFFIDKNIPYIIGASAEHVVDLLLAGTNLHRSHVAHWIVHSGGKKVIDAVRVNLGLTRDDLRHTSAVLHDYGNLSSGSFLFSFERLLDEGKAKQGDVGIMMAMGPGSTIETALLEWR
jgi:3,5-dihydroxyphenylacetyl-CoA synthase